MESQMAFIGTEKGHNVPLEMTRTMTHDASSGSERFDLKPAETFQTTYDTGYGEGAMYNDKGELIKMPAATRDPMDPLNIPTWHKILGLMSLSFFGALIASAELILGAALPVFAIEYSPYDYKTILAIPLQAGINPLGLLESLGGPPIFDVYMLASAPILVIGFSNLFLVPTAIAIGRRPTVVITGCLAIAGAVWAGKSESLGSHIAARCIQAIGAGSVESLIPFIIQDIVHVHERNTWISAAFACQGVIIIALGFSAPYLIINLSWRDMYFITAGGAGFFLIGVLLFLPETRWSRTRSEMNGIPRADEDVHYPPRTWARSLSVLPVSKWEWKKGVTAFVNTMKTFFYPQIFFVTMLNGGVIASAFAAGFTTAPALLEAPWAWPFKHLGLCLIAVLVAALVVAGVTGGLADYVANYVAKKRGRRIPENQLLNLVLPAITGFLGALLFGIAGNDPEKYHWMVFLLALSFMCFGFLGISTVSTVYVLESYPHLAGPALVNIASFRWIIAFFLTFYASDWIVDLGYLKTFGIYAGVIGGFSALIPVLYIYGPAWRARWPATHLSSH